MKTSRKYQMSLQLLHNCWGPTAAAGLGPQFGLSSWASVGPYSITRKTVQLKSLNIYAIWSFSVKLVSHTAPCGVPPLNNVYKVPNFKENFASNGIGGAPMDTLQGPLWMSSVRQ